MIVKTNTNSEFLTILLTVLLGNRFAQKDKDKPKNKRALKIFKHGVLAKEERKDSCKDTGKRGSQRIYIKAVSGGVRQSCKRYALRVI